MTHKQAANIIRYLSVGFFIMALVFASGAFASFDGASKLLHDVADWPMDGSMADYTREAKWFSAIGGGLFAGYSVLFFLVVAPLVEQGSSLVIRGTIISMLVWFVIDSAGSVAAGVPTNVVFNVGFLAVFLGPLLAIREPAGAIPDAG